MINSFLFNKSLALRENMEIQNKNDEMQREVLQLRRDNAEKMHLQRTIEK